jgi:thiol-disulfide isomerase/thioredoxin
MIVNCANRMAVILRIVFPIVALACCGIGCDSQPPVTKPAGAPVMPEAAVPPADGIQLQQIDKAGLSAIIGHIPGKVVLIDFWATWCPACRTQLAHTVDLSRRFGPQGLVVISLACDDKNKTDEVLNVLRQENATFQNLRSAYGSDEQTFEDFEIEGGALPHYKLYDRKGKLLRTFASDPTADKQFSLDDVDAAVVELLSDAQKRGESKVPQAQ